MDVTKAVLVTGASTGIGRTITEWLAAKSCFVYAGARKDADLDSLGTIKNVQALRFDVTKSRDIAAALQAITKGGRGLYGLVNNAGVATFGSVLSSNDDEFDLVMAVNVYGPFRVTKAFARLIAAEKGRIVMIGSISGTLADSNLSAYSMSKHAIEALTDSLSSEMTSSGVHVSIVEPGKFKTELVKKAAERIGASLPLLDLSKTDEPGDVAVAVAHALFNPAPKRRYLVVSNDDEAHRTIKKQIAQLIQLNEGHAYSYDRDELVKMLDEAFAQARPRVPSPRLADSFTHQEFM